MACNQNCDRGNFPPSYWALAIALLLAQVAVSPALAQSNSARLMDQPPFDVLTLDKANDSKVFRIYPVQLPGRRVPDRPRPTDKLRVRLLDTGEEYDVAWQHIDKLELFEQRVLAEAGKYTAEGNLDDAYDTLQFLLAYYPQTSGLAETRQNYLYASSGAAFRQQKFDEALALLEELHALNPSFKATDTAAPLLQRLGVVADRLLAKYVDAGDFPAARLLLARLSKQYKADNESFIVKWREDLTSRATQLLTAATSSSADGNYVSASEAVTRAQSIWPDLPGLEQLATNIARAHPLVRVGVQHPARSFDSRSLLDVSARRAGRLRERLLVEQTTLGIEGGTYTSPIAELSTADDGLSLRLLFHAFAAENEYPVAQRLRASATHSSPDFNAPLASQLAAIELPAPRQLLIRFHKMPLLPAALLRLPLPGLLATAGEPYVLGAESGDVLRFKLRSGDALLQKGQPAEVHEHYFRDPQRALLALRRGEVDLLDHVFPGDISLLRSDSSLALGAMARPTTHILLPRSSHPYLASATFRRALLYGANRELLLTQGLLRGATLPGFRLISSPFPAAAPGLDTPAYGYDEQIEPRSFDPRLGMALVLLAENEVKSAFEKREQKPPPRAPLLLGHPADEVSRIACRGLIKDWKRIGVECTALEFAPGIFDDSSGKCDIIYAQLAIGEPWLDAARIFASGGLAPSTSPTIQLALRELESARNWQEARRQLTLLHRLIHEEVTVLPLWQTIDHFAYRRSSLKLSPTRLTLYQDVESWRPHLMAGEARP